MKHHTFTRRFHSSFIPTNVSMGLPCSVKNKRRRRRNPFFVAIGMRLDNRRYYLVMGFIGLILGLIALYLYR